MSNNEMNKSASSFYSWPIEHYRISLLIVSLLFLLGVYGLYVMPKDEFPHVTVRQGVVVAVYPGATTEEVEEQVARPLERFLFTYNEVNRSKTTTTSQNGMCIVMVGLNDNVSNKDEVWSKLKLGLQQFKPSLPQGVVALVTNDDFGNTSALLIAIESGDRSYRELRQYSDRLGDRLRRIPSVTNVKLYGEQRQQISLYVDRQRLQAYGIGQQLLLATLQGEGLTTLSGSLDDADQHIPLHIAPTGNDVEQIASLIIYNDAATGKTVRLSDVARVVREYDPNASRIEHNGHPCVLLSMEMIPGNNVVEYGRQVNRVLDEFRAEVLPEDVTLTRIADKPKVVELSVRDFLRDLLLSILIIIVVMMVLFPLRSAVVAAITIPLSTFVSVAFMYLAGVELNIVTLAALIIVLGMIVDNSIVIIDGYLEYVGKGMAPRDAAVASARQYFMPMLLATVCISVIFFPLLFTLKGAFNDALRDFPWTMGLNLLTSLVLAVAVIPFLCVKIIGVPDTSKQGVRFTDRVQAFYTRVLQWVFRHPWLTIGLGFGSVVVSLLIVPTLKIRQFPFADRDQFAVEIFLPEGRGLAETEAVADSVRHVLEQDERITAITSFLGCSSPRFMDSYAPQMADKNYAQFIVGTTSQQATLDLLSHYQPLLSEAFPNAYVRFKRLDMLFVTELEYRFYGDDIDSLHVVADRMMERMRQMEGLEWVHTDYLQPSPIVNVELDPVKAAQMGVTRASAALALSAASGSLRVGQLWEGDYEVPIVVMDDTDYTFSDVQNWTFSTPLTMVAGGLGGANSTIALRQVADVKPLWSESRIVHRGGERCITVTAEMAKGVYAAPLEKRLADIMLHEIDLPEGVRAEVGGELECNSDALPQIFQGVLIALIIIFFFLLFNFKRFGITFLCMVALVLMAPGALVGLGIMNRTLGLTSVMGVITLLGIIMRNEILIFEHADGLMKRFHAEHPQPVNATKEEREAYRRNFNYAIEEAAYDAGRRRMVPIFLTTATTAVGVIPMIIAGSSFWMPVGITIFAGGIGTLILVVTVLPVLYWKLSVKK
jgi:multidrug efflux pump subunit AcrB